MYDVNNVLCGHYIEQRGLLKIMNDYSYSIKFQNGKIITQHSQVDAKMEYTFQMGHLQMDIISVEKVFPDPTWYCREHSHVYFEFHIIAGGTGTITIEGKSFTVKRGCFFITGPDVKHIQISDPKYPMTEYNVKFNLRIIEDTVLNDHVQKKESLDIIKTLSKIHSYPFQDIYDIKSMVDNVFEIVNDQKPGYTLAFQSQMANILHNFYQTICTPSTHLKENHLIFESHKDRAKMISNFIEKNYMKNITISDLEQHIFLSYKQINRILKKEFNQTFSEYLQMLRFKKSTQLIKETSLTIEQIANQCGFSTVRNLYQVFKKYQSPSPLQLREKL